MINAEKNTTIQPQHTRRKKSHWTFLVPPASPTPTTAPTMLCVEETGITITEAVTTSKKAASSAQAPREGERMVIFPGGYFHTCHEVLAKDMLYLKDHFKDTSFLLTIVYIKRGTLTFHALDIPVQ